MSETPLLGLPLLEAAQAQKHVTHNEALLRLDSEIHLSALSRALATPPATPTDGDRYLVGTAATDDWAGHDGEFAFREAGSWRFAPPQAGYRVWVADEQAYLVYTGTIWRDVTAIDALQNMTLLGVNATADSSNRLAVSSPGVLFSHEGSDQQVKINKQAATDTASLLYQTNFSGRAEMGIAGNDDFHIKVSADGTSWLDAIQIDRTTGAVTMPYTGGGGGGSLSDGDHGDIVVSGGGSTLTIDTGVVTTAKLGGDITTAGKAILDDTDAAAQRATLGLGTLATQSGTFSGSSSGTNTGDQSLFGTIAVAGQSDVVADQAGDTLTLLAGSNITITTDAATDTITISGTGGATLGDGDYGDITVSGTGTAMTIDNAVVTLAKMADMATASLIYRKTAGGGVPEVNSLATLKTDLGLTGTNSGDQTITLTGDVTGSGTGSFATTIAAGVVSTTELGGDITTAGKAMVSAADTAAQTALLDLASTTAKGLMSSVDKSNLDAMAVNIAAQMVTDGVTDNAATIQAALAAIAATGGTVYLGPGVIAVTGNIIKLHANTCLAGMGRGMTVLKPLSSWGSTDVLIQNATAAATDRTTRADENCGLRDLTIDAVDCPYISYPTAGYNNAGSLVRFRRAIRPFVTDCELKDFRQGYAIREQGCYGARFTGNYFTGCGKEDMSSGGIFSGSYLSEFVIRSVSKANPCVITFFEAHGFSISDVAFIENVRGMTELGDGEYTVTATTALTITLGALDSTTFTDYLLSADSRVRDRYGIDSVATVITANHAKDLHRVGCYIHGIGTKVSGNTFDGCKECGISVYGTRGAIITDNHVSRSLLSDIVASGSEIDYSADLVFSGNFIDNVEGNGIRVGGLLGGTIANNTIKQCGITAGLTYPTAPFAVAAGLNGTVVPASFRAGILYINQNEFGVIGIHDANNGFVEQRDGAAALMTYGYRINKSGNGNINGPFNIESPGFSRFNLASSEWISQDTAVFSSGAWVDYIDPATGDRIIQELSGTGSLSAPGAGALSDGDYGDVVVSGSGTVMTLDPVRNAKLLAADAFINGVENSTFEAGDISFSKGGSWAIVNDSANAQSGNYVASNTSTSGTSETMSSQSYQPVVPGDTVEAGCWFRTTSFVGTHMRVAIAWYDKDFGFLSSSNGTDFSTDQPGYVESRATVTAPASAAYAQWRCNTTHTGGTVWCDNPYLTKKVDATRLLSDATVTAAQLGGDITLAGKAILDDADATAQRATLGLVIGTDVQAHAAALDSVSGTNTGDQTITLTGDVTGSGTGSFAATIAAGVVSTTELGGDITTAGKAILDDANAAAQRTTLGLGTGALVNISVGTSAPGSPATGDLWVDTN
jgi:hypothetical protein